MKRRLPDSETQRDLEVTEEKPGDKFGDCNTGDQKDIGDIEMANSTNETTSDVEFTHVLIPRPGYDSNGTLVMEESEDCNSSERDKKSTPTTNKLFFFKSKNRNEEHLSEECNDHESKITEGDEECKEEEECAPDDIEDDVNKQSVLAENREVPIFCAVCLMEYEVKDRLCWSSNGECTHVFHEHCILQWLISLGRKRSKRQTFTRNPTEQRLLDFCMQCPCCRQDFISKNLTLSAAPEGQEDSTHLSQFYVDRQYNEPEAW